MIANLKWERQGMQTENPFRKGRLAKLKEIDSRAPN